MPPTKLTSDIELSVDIKKASVEKALKDLEKASIEVVTKFEDSFNEAFKDVGKGAKISAGMLKSSLGKVVEELTREVSDMSKQRIFSSEALKTVGTFETKLKKVNRAIAGLSKDADVDQVSNEIRGMVSELKSSLSVIQDTSRDTDELTKMFAKIPILLANVDKKQHSILYCSTEIRKEFETIEDEFKKVNKQAAELQRKGEFSKDSYKSLEDNVSALTKRYVRAVEASKESTKALDDSIETVNTSLKNASRLAENVSSSTGQISFGTVSDELMKAQKELMAFKNSGKFSADEIQSVNDKIKQTNKDLDSAAKMFKSLDSIISESAKDAEEMQQGIAKQNMEGIQKSAKDVLNSFTNWLSSEQKSEEELKNIKKTLEEIKDKSDIAKQWKENNSEIKASNSALIEVKKALDDINGEQQKIVNSGLKAAYENQLKVVKELAAELEKMALSGSDGAVIKQKTEDLKKQKGKLEDIGKQDEKMQGSSIAGTIKRARAESTFNRDMIKNIMSQKRGFSGLVDASGVFIKNLKPAAIEKFGAAGVVAGKGIAIAMSSAMALFQPLQMFIGLFALIQGAFALEKQIKGARKQIIMMAADTGEASGVFDQLGKGTQLVNTDIEQLRKQAEKWSWSLGVSMETALGYMQGFVKEGFKVKDSMRNLQDMMGLSVSLGMDMNDLSTRAGNLRSEFGMSLGEIGSAFVDLQNDAKTAGMTTNRFFDKIINTTVGLGLYNKKISDVSKTFVQLTKNMRLPEEAAKAAAGGMMKTVSDLAPEMQATLFKVGKGSEEFNKSFIRQTKALDENISGLEKSKKASQDKIDSLTNEGRATDAAAEAEKLAGINTELESKKFQKAQLLNAKSMNGLNGEIQKMRMMDVEGQTNVMLHYAGMDDLTHSLKGASKKFDKMKFEKLGEQIGMSRESLIAIEQKIESLDYNTQMLDKAFEKSGVKSDDIIGILSSTANQQERSDKIFKKLEKTDTKSLRNIFDTLSKEFPTYFANVGDVSRLSNEELRKVIADGTKQIDTSMQGSVDIQKEVAKAEDLKKKKAAGLEALRQTKSTQDAIENTIGRFVRGIFAGVEKFVSMFGIVNKGQLSGFSDVYDAIQDNKQVLDENMSKINDRKQATEKALGELEDPQGKDKELASFYKQQLVKLDELTKLGDAAQQSNTSLEKIAENDYKQNGKYTKTSSNALTQTVDKLANISDGMSSLDEDTQRQKQSSSKGGNLVEIKKGLDISSDIQPLLPKASGSISSRQKAKQDVQAQVDLYKTAGGNPYGQPMMSYTPQKSISESAGLSLLNADPSKVMPILPNVKIEAPTPLIPNQSTDVNNSSQSNVGNKTFNNTYIINQNDKKTVEQIALKMFYDSQMPK